MIKKDYSLYWEDVGESLIYAELDDYAWKFPEKVCGYKKRSSIYIYHDGRLSAFYSSKDSAKEALVGRRFFGRVDNYKKIIGLKRRVFERVQKLIKGTKDTSPEALSNEEIKNKLLDTLGCYKEALGVHYLSQPQFFESFTPADQVRLKKQLDSLGKARFKYTRVAWTDAMNESKKWFKVYAKRLHLSPDLMEYMLYNEITSDKLDSSILKKRRKKFVLLSNQHILKVLTGARVDKYVQRYEPFGRINEIKGSVGNKGYVKGQAFVLKNEHLNLKKLPGGMKKGMVLVVQNAWPELTRYYKLAAALVTNEGGITSHGIVVAREYKIPAIIGAKIATKVFKTGDLVEVDAERGIVRKLKKFDSFALIPRCI